MNLRILETAKAEFWEAVAYYEQEREGLGGEFAREISKALDRIVDHPNACVLYLRERDNVALIDFLTLSFIR